jgi:serine/threonine-protein kinase 24/25/MST4
VRIHQANGRGTYGRKGGNQARATQQHGPQSQSQGQGQAQNQNSRPQAAAQREPENARINEEQDEEGILDTVVIPVLDSIYNRITNQEARKAVYKLRLAIEEAEGAVPGLMNVFVSELVESVEPIEEEE